MTDFELFYQHARKAAIKTKAGRTITGETIRLRLINEGITPSRNTYMAHAVQRMIREGLLETTGEYVKMSSEQARGRWSPEYIRQSTR